MTINGAQIITHALRNEGVDTIFTVAGDHILPLLSRQPSIWRMPGAA